MARGGFCVLEGIDGSGKSTLARRLFESLRGDSSLPYAAVRLQAEPADTAPGRRLRELLKSRAELAPAEWLELFLEDRALNVAENIQPLREKGVFIVQDRYFYSTAAYQGDPGGEFPPEKILALNRERGFPEPDLLFYLDILPEKALERIHAAREELESFEKLSVLNRIYENYRRILPPWTILLDAELSEQALLDEALARVREISFPG